MNGNHLRTQNNSNSDSCSIVIRCYNEEKHIGKLLHGITQQTIKNVEILIVDSGSKDGTLAIASRYPTKIICIEPENFSFGRSLNLGCDSASKEFIVSASAHVYPLHTDWLEQLLTPFKNPELSLVYGKQVGDKTTKISEHQIFAKWFPNKPNASQDHPFCNNANSAIRQKVWEKHRYDEYLTGLEDIAWAKATMKSGYKIAYQPKAVVGHIHEENRLQIFNRYRREAIALKRIFPNENFTIIDFTRFFISNVISDFVFSLRSQNLKSNWYEIPVFRLMQFWGTYVGFSKSSEISGKMKHKFYYPEQKQRKGKKIAIKSNRPHLLIDYEKGDRNYRENL